MSILAVGTVALDSIETPFGAADDVLGGSAVDVTMVVTLAHMYGISLTWNNARQLIESILKASCSNALRGRNASVVSGPSRTAIDGSPIVDSVMQGGKSAVDSHDRSGGQWFPSQDSIQRPQCAKPERHHPDMQHQQWRKHHPMVRQ